MSEGWFDGEGEVEGRTHQFIVGNANCAAMTVDDGFGDVETQANTRIVAAGCVAYTVETLEDVVDLFRTDTNALIFNRYQVAIFALLQRYYDLTTMRRIFDCIIQDIANNLADTLSICYNAALLNTNV